MSKAERRDSSACELEQKLRDVKSNNCRFRKALMDREAELQALVRKLGQEASSWLDGGNSETEPILKDQGRLSVGPVRKDLPSQTGKTWQTQRQRVQGQNKSFWLKFLQLQKWHRSEVACQVTKTWIMGHKLPTWSMLGQSSRGLH